MVVFWWSVSITHYKSLCLHKILHSCLAVFTILKKALMWAFSINEDLRYSNQVFNLHSRLCVREWLLRDGDAGVGGSGRTIGAKFRCHLYVSWSRCQLRTSHWESFATERRLFLQHSLDIGVTGGLLELLRVHAVPERVHHSYLKHWHSIRFGSGLTGNHQQA